MTIEFFYLFSKKPLPLFSGLVTKSFPTGAAYSPRVPGPPGPKHHHHAFSSAVNGDWAGWSINRPSTRWVLLVRPVLEKRGGENSGRGRAAQ